MCLAIVTRAMMHDIVLLLCLGSVAFFAVLVMHYPAVFGRTISSWLRLWLQHNIVSGGDNVVAR